MFEVACVTEGDYVPHSAAMLHSLLVHSQGAAVRIHYLHGPEFSATDERLLAEMVEGHDGSISFTAVPDDLCEGLPTEGFTGKATWYRIFLPDLFPKLERILFLDLDLIVTDSLQPLWETDLQDRLVAAVTNVLPPHYAERLASAGFDTSAYFNAGVLLMDLDRMRQQDCTASMLNYGISHAESLVLRDQDALNAVLADHRLPLDPRWNCMNSFFVYPWSEDLFDSEILARAKSKPAIRHFEGPAGNKPWHYLCEHDSCHLYAEHRKQTPWPRFRKDGTTPRNFIRRSKRKVRYGLGSRLAKRLGIGA